MAQAAISATTTLPSSWGAIAVALTPGTAGSVIGFDAALAGGYTLASATHTVAFTCGATANYLLVGVTLANPTDTLTGVTYNGVAMTKIAATLDAHTLTGWQYLYGLANPTVGAHNVVATASGAAALIGATMASYSGCSTTQPHASTTTVSIASPLVWTVITTTVAGCWVVQFSRNVAGILASAIGGTVRASETTDGLASIIDTNGVVQIATPITLNPNTIGWALERIDLKPSQGEHA